MSRGNRRAQSHCAAVVEARDAIIVRPTACGSGATATVMWRAPTVVVPKYMQQQGYTFNVAMMTPEWERALGDVKGLPVIWVIGRDGRLKQVEAREMFDGDLDELTRWL